MMLGDLVWGLVGFLLTVMVLSYLVGDNPLFRLAAYLFIGITAGYLSVLIVYQILWPFLLSPLIYGSWTARLWMVIPLALILLLLAGQTARFSWLAGIPLAYLAGLTAAIVIGGAVFGTLIPQSLDLMMAFDPVRRAAGSGPSWLGQVEGLVMLLGVIGTLSFFHFGRRKGLDGEDRAAQRPPVFEALSKIGQVFIGIALGAVFSGVFSTALLALIDRIIFIHAVILQLLGAG